MVKGIDGADVAMWGIVCVVVAFGTFIFFTVSDDVDRSLFCKDVGFDRPKYVDSSKEWVCVKYVDDPVRPGLLPVYSGVIP